MSVKTVEEDFDRQKTSFFLNREIFMRMLVFHGLFKHKNFQDVKIHNDF